MSVKSKWFFIGVLVIAVLVYGFYPLSTSQWDIKSNKNKLEYKLNYLKNLKLSDTIKKPNLVLIVADDLGKMDISTYGGSNLKTPEIDKLASQGVRFEQGYVTSAICSPSRAGLLTGRNQSRFGYEHNVHERYPKNGLEKFVYSNFLATDAWQVAEQNSYPTEAEMEKQGIPAEEILISEMLHRVGYRTGVLGKWHLGYSDMSIPINRGFDYQYGFYEAFSLYQSNLESPDIVNQTCPDFSDPFIWKKGRTGNCAIRKNHLVFPEEGYLTDRIAQEAETFIETNKDTSFFLYVAFNAPHTPFQAQKKYYDMFSHIKDPHKRVYYAMIKNLDDAVGRINIKLENLGLAENTLLVFLSDNGGATYTTATDNAPLKGGKMTHFEGGLNVPFFMKWKSVIDSNQVYDNPVVATDIVSTFCKQINLPLPADRSYDGVNLLPYLNDSIGNQSTQLNQPHQPHQPHEKICWRSDYLRSIRKGNWKLIHDRLSNQLVLYSMKENNFEKVNLASQNADKLNELLQDLDDWEKELEPKRWPRVMDFKYNDGVEFSFPL